jgi:hypothetical protein
VNRVPARTSSIASRRSPAEISSSVCSFAGGASSRTAVVSSSGALASPGGATTAALAGFAVPQIMHSGRGSGEGGYGGRRARAGGECVFMCGVCTDVTGQLGGRWCYVG